MAAYRPQRTLRNVAECRGVGLFSGVPVTVRFRPAPPDSGTVFVRTDLPGRPRIPAVIETAHLRYRRTAVGREGETVETVEHVLAAVHGCGLDNLEIEIDGPELPGGDGSAGLFLEALQKAQIVEQPAPRPTAVLREPVAIEEDGATLTALPAEDGLTVTYTMDYREFNLELQHRSVRLSPESFAKELAPARTFCFRSEVEQFLRQGLGKGADPQQQLVIEPDGRPNLPLRFSDECVRHKLLDLTGDLFLLNAPLAAHVVAVKSGHAANLKLVQRLSQILAQQAPRQKETWLDVREILKILPHRYPFLLVDKVIELDSYQRAVGIKNVTFNEPYFQGHFPGQPIMPGVLQIEAMAQLAGALLMRKAENANRLAVLLSIDQAKLRKTVVPGDQLRIEAEVVKLKMRTGHVHTRCLVNGQVAAEAQLKFMLVDPTAIDAPPPAE